MVFSNILKCTLYLGVSLSVLAAPVVADENTDILTFLDANNDGELNPFEALDRLLQVQQEAGDKAIKIADFGKLFAQIKAERKAEVEETMVSIDANENGKVSLRELKKVLGDLAQGIDADNNKIITADELEKLDFSKAIAVSEKDIKEEVAYIFEALDENSDKKIKENEMPEPAVWDELKDKDLNRDGAIVPAELTIAFRQDSELARFDIQNDIAVMTGTIGSSTPAKVLELVFKHPEVTTIKLLRVPGSIDDESNLRAAAYVRQFGLNTVLASNSMVASGGTDFFLAGVKRSVAPGALLGVHSWGGPGFQGKDVPKDDEQHTPYLEYYNEMGIPAAFYWYTLEAAPADGLHWMTGSELKKFKFVAN